MGYTSVRRMFVGALGILLISISILLPYSKDWKMELNDIISLIDAITGTGTAEAQINPKGVAYVESRGMTPTQKLKPGPAGEIGTYQITPSMFADLVQNYPQKYKNKKLIDVAGNDATALPALMDAFSIINGYQKSYKLPTDDNTALQIYNLGIGSYLKGRRNPSYIRTYEEGLSR